VRSSASRTCPQCIRSEKQRLPASGSCSGRPPLSAPGARVEVMAAPRSERRDPAEGAPAGPVRRSPRASSAASSPTLSWRCSSTGGGWASGRDGRPAGGRDLFARAGSGGGRGCPGSGHRGVAGGHRGTPGTRSRSWSVSSAGMLPTPPGRRLVMGWASLVGCQKLVTGLLLRME
jgi:hypothetical protein